MKESKLYLHFFRKNLPSFLIIVFICIGLGLSYVASLPKKYSSNQLFEMGFVQNNLSERIALVDNIITLLRSPNLQASLNLKSSSITVFKKSSLLVDVTLTDNSEYISQNDLNLVSSYLLNHYPIYEVGKSSSHEIRPNYIKVFLLSFIIGFVLSAILILSSTYFKKY